MRFLRNLKYSQALATRYEKKISPPTKKIFGGRAREVYTMMENNDTNTDYHKFITLGDQMWETGEITMGILFSFLLKICIHYFYTGSFQVTPKKNDPHT